MINNRKLGNLQKNYTTPTSYDLWKHLVRRMKIEMSGVGAGVEKCLFYLKPRKSFIIEKDFAEIWKNLLQRLRLYFLYLLSNRGNGQTLAI